MGLKDLEVKYLRINDLAGFEGFGSGLTRAGRLNFRLSKSAAIGLAQPRWPWLGLAHLGCDRSSLLSRQASVVYVMGRTGCL